MLGSSRHGRPLADRLHKPSGTFVVTCSSVPADTSSVRPFGLNKAISILHPATYRNTTPTRSH